MTHISITINETINDVKAIYEIIHLSSETFTSELLFDCFVDFATLISFNSCADSYLNK
jgi:hypothetical protein